MADKVFSPRGQTKKPSWCAKFVLFQAVDDKGRFHFAIYKRIKEDGETLYGLERSDTDYFRLKVGAIFSAEMVHWHCNNYERRRLNQYEYSRFELAVKANKIDYFIIKHFDKLL